MEIILNNLKNQILWVWDRKSEKERINPQTLHHWQTYEITERAGVTEEEQICKLRKTILCGIELEFLDG